MYCRQQTKEVAQNKRGDIKKLVYRGSCLYSSSSSGSRSASSMKEWLRRSSWGFHSAVSVIVYGRGGGTGSTSAAGLSGSITTGGGGGRREFTAAAVELPCATKAPTAVTVHRVRSLEIVAILYTVGAGDASTRAWTYWSSLSSLVSSRWILVVMASSVLPTVASSLRVLVPTMVIISLLCWISDIVVSCSASLRFLAGFSRVPARYSQLALPL